MTWLRDDDDMLDHEKWRRALRDGGDGVLLVWARLRAWCSRRLTDGRIPADMVDSVAEIGRSKSRARALRALVEHGLCARLAHGELTIVDYLERNPSRARVLEERGRRAEAQRKRRLGENVTGHEEITETQACPSVTKSRPGPLDQIPLTPLAEPAIGEVTAPDSATAPADAGAPAASTSKLRLRKRRETRAEAPLPADWAPTAEHRSYASKHGIDLGFEADALRGWADGRTAVSWNGTFSTRLANAAKWKRERGAPVGQKAPLDLTTEAAWLR